jgi:hypothetical protein
VREIGDAHEEADSVEDVTLAGTVEAGDGIEGRIKPVDFGTVAVRLKAVDYHRLYEHF